MRMHAAARFQIGRPRVSPSSSRLQAGVRQNTVGQVSGRGEHQCARIASGPWCRDELRMKAQSFTVPVGFTATSVEVGILPADGR
jgi:hypothetical protein